MAQIDSDDFPRFEEEFFLFFLQSFLYFFGSRDRVSPVSLQGAVTFGGTTLGGYCAHVVCRVPRERDIELVVREIRRGRAPTVEIVLPT